jgi:sugar phosphate isomerase/epimerase
MPIDPIILGAGTLLGTPFLDRLAPARAAGFAGVSMFVSDYEALVAAGHDAAGLRARISDAGLVLTDFETIATWYPGQAPPPEMHAGLAGQLLRATPAALCPIAAAMGARSVTLIDMFGVAAPLDVMAAALAGTAAIADYHGLAVLVEFVPTGTIPDLATAWKLIETAGAANLGLVVDSWHFFRSGSSLDQLRRIPGARIGCIQLNDAPLAPEANLAHAMVHDRLLPGAGEFDLAGLMAALRATGTTAPLTIEVFSDALNSRPDAIALAAASMQAWRHG